MIIDDGWRLKLSLMVTLLELKKNLFLTVRVNWAKINFKLDYKFFNVFCKLFI
jgi:hypothetical protein